MNQDKYQDGLFMTFEQKELFCKFCRIWELNPEFKDKKYDKFLKAYWKDKDKATPQELFDCFVPDYKDGRLFCKKTGRDRVQPARKENQYNTVSIYSKNKSKQYQLHIVLWTMYHGRWPKPNMMIDHRDLNKTNNSISNLFEVTHEGNANNKKIKNYKYGISFRRYTNSSKKFRVTRCGKHLGYFKTHEEAMARSLAYDKQLKEQGIKPPSQQA